MAGGPPRQSPAALGAEQGERQTQDCRREDSGGGGECIFFLKNGERRQACKRGGWLKMKVVGLDGIAAAGKVGEGLSGD